MQSAVLQPEELKKMREEAIQSGNFVTLSSGDKLAALPLVVAGGRRGYRVYLGEYDLYYRRGKRYGWLGRLSRDMWWLNLAHSPLKPKKERKLPREVENVFKFFRLASSELNPIVWGNALGYLNRLRAALGVEDTPKRIYQLLNREGWKESYPLPDGYLWDGAQLKQPWRSLRSLTGETWGAEEDLRRLAREALEKGEARETPCSLKYSVKVRFNFILDPLGYETGVSAEYQGLAHGHYGFIVNWRGTVFLSESD